MTTTTTITTRTKTKKSSFTTFVSSKPSNATCSLQVSIVLESLASKRTVLCEDLLCWGSHIEGVCTTPATNLSSHTFFSFFSFFFSFSFFFFLLLLLAALAVVIAFWERCFFMKALLKSFFFSGGYCSILEVDLSRLFWWISWHHKTWTLRPQATRLHGKRGQAGQAVFCCYSS